MSQTSEKKQEKNLDKDLEKEIKEAQDKGVKPEGIDIPEDTEETQVQFPANIKLPSNPMIYAGIGIAVVALLVILFGSKKKKGEERQKTETSANVTEANTAKNDMESDMGNGRDRSTQIASVHEIGAREDQQDSFGVSEETKGTMLVVADGMGGLNNGGQISSLAVTTALNLFRQFPEHMSPADILLETAGHVNYTVNQFLRGKQRGGSTFVSAIVRGKYLHFLTIGDSRIYLYRNGVLLQLNREHIYKEELALDAANGKMPVGRIHTDPQAKSLTSYLGNGQIVHLDRNAEGIRLKDKDRILMASDGIFGTVIPEQLEAALALPMEEAAARIKAMVNEANKPHQDNFTALIYEYKSN